MSNALVGNIYRSIMDEVIDSSRVDFEEGGVDEAVLEDLRKIWQNKLTELKIAQFPWDPPPPAPAPAAAAAPSAPQAAAASQQVGNASYTSAQLSPPSNVQPDWNKSGPGPQNANGQQFRPEPLKQDPSIKQEPSMSNSMPPAAPGNAPQFSNAGGGNVAAQRAMSQLQNQYGARAAASISAIQGYGQGGQSGQSAQAQRPAQTGPSAQAAAAQTTTQYSQQMRQQAAQQAQRAQQAQQSQQHPGQQHPGQQHPGQQHPGQQHPGQQHPGQQHAGQQRPVPPQQNPSQQNNSGQNGFQQSQVDGAVDGDTFEGVLMHQNKKGETTEMARVDIDRMLHEQMTVRAKAMEGGGFMLPLKEATKSKSVARKAGSIGPSAFDGGLDSDVKKEEEDETIGSDLDDPNEVDVEDDDDEVDQIMLCMYDKVQRVKNKWKCTLKDGIMNVNGKDYVFHKATGEYEW